MDKSIGGNRLSRGRGGLSLFHKVFLDVLRYYQQDKGTHNQTDLSDGIPDGNTSHLCPADQFPEHRQSFCGGQINLICWLIKLSRFVRSEWNIYVCLKMRRRQPKLKLWYLEKCALPAFRQNQKRNVRLERESTEGEDIFQGLASHHFLKCTEVHDALTD